MVLTQVPQPVLQQAQSKRSKSKKGGSKNGSLMRAYFPNLITKKEGTQAASTGSAGNAVNIYTKSQDQYNSGQPRPRKFINNSANISMQNQGHSKRMNSHSYVQSPPPAQTIIDDNIDNQISSQIRVEDNEELHSFQAEEHQRNSVVDSASQ